MTLSEEDAETKTCPDCGEDLELIFGDVLGVSFVHYLCPRHGVNARLEFLR